MTIFIFNELHNQKTLANAKIDKNNKPYLTKQQYRRIEKDLCGFKDCCCPKISIITDSKRNFYILQEEYVYTSDDRNNKIYLNRKKF